MSENIGQRDAVHETMRDLSEQLAGGGLSDREQAAINARLRRLRADYGDPPPRPACIGSAEKTAAPVFPPVQSDPIFPGSEDRFALWTRLAELNSDPGDGVELDSIARKLGLP